MLKGFLRIPWLANKKFIIFYYLGVVAICCFHVVYGKQGYHEDIKSLVGSKFGYVAVRDSLYIGGIHLLIALLILIKERYGRILACIVSGIKILLSGFTLIPYFGGYIAIGLHLGFCHVFDSFVFARGSAYGYYLYFFPLFIFHLLSFREIDKTCEISITKIVTPVVFLANILSIPMWIYVRGPDRSLGDHFNSPLIVFHALVAVFIWWIMTRKWGWFRKKRKSE